MAGGEQARVIRGIDAVPQLESRKHGWVDVILYAVAMAAIGGLGVVWWTVQGGPPPGAPVAAGIAAPARQVAWTPEDTARCRVFANKQGTQPIPDEMMLAIPSVTDGFGIMASFLECELTTKVARLCSPEEKATLIGQVNGYLARKDLIATGLHVQGAPMAVLGEMFGGEIAGGSGIYDMQKDDTFEFIEMYDARVTKGLKALAEAGLLQAGDFGGFMGLGVPAQISALIGGVVATKSGCA